MRVIFWGINYAPEPTGIAPYTTELAEYFQRVGLDVEVVTGFAYYPNWRKNVADRRKLYRDEKIGTIPVHRCWQYVPEKLSTVKRVFHEMTFGVTSLIRTLLLRRADVYVVVSPPLGLGVVAWIAASLKRSRFLFHVQDLQPDSAAGLGMVKTGPFLRLMYACERFAYKRAAGVSGISAGMMDAFAVKGIPATKAHLLPNWLRNNASSPATGADAAAFRNENEIPADAMLAVYSGNLGRKQGLEVLLDAAEILEHRPESGSRVFLIIAGDGADRKVLHDRMARRPLANVRLLPLQSAEKYQAMLRAADVALVTQMPGTGQVCFPSKLLSVLSAGLPVITTADETSDLARSVRDGGFGMNVSAASPTKLADALQQVARNPGLLAEWRARTCWVDRFSPDAILPKFEATVRKLAADPKYSEAGLGTIPERMNSR
ncbi:MAG TPA: WcaI family glycosyltransferase [Lacunisphaera sp.]|jgi:colanic acid biosynthesis glycosyl transferase WcaI